MTIREERIAAALQGAMRRQASSGTSPGDGRATVVRVEGHTAWVHFEGGVSETPVDMTINCVAGDVVQVRRYGGRAWLVGNHTVPPTGDVEAIAARIAAKAAQGAADAAREKADEAGVAASKAQESADSAGDAASEAGERLNGVISVDCVYSQTDTAYTFTGYVFRGGVDVTEQLLAEDPSKFGWTRKTEDGEETIAKGVRSVTVGKATLGYGGTVTFSYDEAQGSSLLTTESEAVLSTGGEQLVAAASSASVRLDQLPAGTVTDGVDVMLWDSSTFRASVGDLSAHVLSHNSALTNMEIERMLAD